MMREAKYRAERGVCSATFMTTVLPVASAGASFQPCMTKGKFHGISWPHTNRPMLGEAEMLTIHGDGLAVPLVSQAKYWYLDDLIQVQDIRLLERRPMVQGLQ